MCYLKDRPWTWASFSVPPGSLFYNSVLDVIFIQTTNYWNPIHVSFSASEVIFPGDDLSSPSASPFTSVCGNGRIVVNFKMEFEASSCSDVCAQMRQIYWAVWSGLVTTEQMLSGGGERVCEEGNFFFVGTWVEWKPACLFLYFSEVKVIMFLRLISEQFRGWLASAALWTRREKWKLKFKRTLNHKRKGSEGIWHLHAAGFNSLVGHIGMEMFHSRF